MQCLTYKIPYSIKRLSVTFFHEINESIKDYDGSKYLVKTFC